MAEVRRAYKVIALKVHPDKCRHERATEAFQLLSEAFDTLHDRDSQSDYLASLTRNKRYERHERPAKRKKRSRRSWYQGRSWEDIERHLRQREAAEKAMRQNFMSSMSSKYNERKWRAQLSQAERTCYDLDNKAQILENDLWPAQPNEDGEVPLLDAQSAFRRLNEALLYMRDEYHYCMFCGINFTDGADLERTCPGFSEEDHDDVESTLDDDYTHTEYTGELDY